MSEDRIRFAAAKLEASLQDRTFRARLLPYGEEGATSIGRVVAGKGSLRLPRDPSSIVGRLGHDDPDQPAASVAQQIIETPDGLMLAGKVLDNDEGDALLAEIQSGARNMVSVEVSRPIIRDGQLVDGKLYAYAHVEQGAFDSARLFAGNGVAPDRGREPADQQLIDRLTAESVSMKTRAQTAERERDALRAELARVNLQHALDDAMNV